MIKNLTLTLLMVFATSHILFSQPPSSCEESEDIAVCDLDDINGAMFTNPDPGTVDVPSEALCGGGAFHNPGWFSFVAGSTDIQLTVTPQMCDTIPGSPPLTGIQVALWEGCPDGGGTCVAGDANCSDQPITLSAANLTIGDIYNLTIDGCAGSVCTVTVNIDQSQPFDIPDVDDVELAEPEYNVRGGCDSGLDEGLFCADLEVLFTINEELYEDLGAEWTWTIDGVSGNADPSTVEWSSGNFTGMGSPVVIGDLSGELGASNVSMVFMEAGTYEICLTSVASECETTTGENCIEVIIIQPGLQDFGEYDVCVLDLVAGWEPPEEDANGNEWGGGTFTLQDVLNAPDGEIMVMVDDDCECEFTQLVKVNPVGSLDREDITLYLLPCQLPYQWFDFEIDNFEDYANGVDEILTEGSAQRDWDGDRCDSLINLTVVELEVIDTVLVGDCTPAGTEFTIEVTAIGDGGEEIDFINPTYEWIDSVTNMVVGTGVTVLLETGVYYVSLTSLVEDINYTDLSGTQTESDCIFLFGPYELEGGSSQEPVVMPYDTTLCSDQLDNVIFVVDTVPNTDYTWIVPSGIPFTVSSQGDSLVANLTNLMPADTIMITAENDCGVSEPVDLPVEIIEGLPPSITAPIEECVSNEFVVSFSGNTADIVSYDWDFGTGVITSGADNTPGPIGVTFPSSGSYTYSLTTIDLGGCEASASFNVDISDPLAAPIITCIGDQTQIEFTWTDVGADAYSVNEITVPMGATGMFTGLTSYTITGLNPNDLAEIEVVAESSGPCGNTTSQEQCNASACNLSGVVIVNFSDMAFCQNNPDNAIIQFEHTLPMGITGTYFGNGIIDADMGLFNPNDPSLVLGANPITFTYMDMAGCMETNEITVTINEMPDASFTPSATTVCQNDIITLDNFSNDPNAVWDYGQGAMGDLNGLSYNDPGTKDVKVVIIDPVTLCADSMEVQIEVLQSIIAPIITCTPEVDQVTFEWEDIVGASSFDVEISVNNTVVFSGAQGNSDYLQTGLNQGDVVDITLMVTGDNGCGMFTVTESCEARTCIIPDIVLSAPQNTFCTNDNLNTVNIGVMVDGNPATGLFQGPGVSDPNVNQFNPMLAGVGMHTVTFSYTNPVDDCVTSETIDFEVIDPPVPDFMVDNNDICIDQSATVIANTLPPNVNQAWNYNASSFNVISPTEAELFYDTPGQFDVVLSYSITGCPPIETTETITVTDTITFPNLRCENSGTDFIEFGWNDQVNVEGYEVLVDNVSQGIQANSDFMLTSLDPATSYTLTVIAIDDECGNREISIDCMTPACVPPTIQSNIPASQCYEPGSGPIQLDVQVESNTGTQGSYTWSSPDIDANDMFTPDPGNNTYNFNLIYTEGNCETIEPVSFTIYETPDNTLDLSVDQEVICVSSTIMVTAEDASITNEFPEWDFGDNSVVNASGTGFGPYELSFTQPGSYPVSLTVDNNGCLSQEEIVTIIVEDELTPPTVSCDNQGVFNLDFSWDNVDCASEYNVFVNGNLETTTSNTSYMLDGLSEMESVDIMVEAVSECACSSVMSQMISCSTAACPSTTFDVSSYENPICLDVTASSFNIDATPVDLQGTGTGAWSGGPVADPSGLIDPTLVTAGTYQLTFDYDENGCSYSYTTDITFVEAPTVNILDVQDPTCISDNVGYINAAGSGGMSSYMYSIDQGTPQASGEFAGVLPGLHTISIEDANGCINSTTVTIDSAIDPTASITGPATVVLDNDATYTIVTNAPNIDDIIWTLNGNVVCQGPSCTSYTIFNAQTDAVLEVTVLFNGNCQVSATFDVDVKEIQAFYVPNIVTPFTNDANAAWKIFIKGSDTYFKSIKVYNRWGNLVHDFVNPEGNVSKPAADYLLWDGYIDDQAAVTEVYVYVLELEIEGIPRIITGNVTIVR